MTNTPPNPTPPEHHEESAKMRAKRARTPNPTAFAYPWDDAAKMSGLSIATLRRLAKKDVLAIVKVGGRTRIRDAAGGAPR